MLTWILVLSAVGLLGVAVMLWSGLKADRAMQQQLSFTVSALASLQRIMLNEVKLPILEALAPQVQQKPEPKKSVREPISLERFGGE